MAVKGPGGARRQAGLAGAVRRCGSRTTAALVAAALVPPRPSRRGSGCSGGTSLLVHGLLLASSLVSFCGQGPLFISPFCVRSFSIPPRTRCGPRGHAGQGGPCSDRVPLILQPIFLHHFTPLYVNIGGDHHRLFIGHFALLGATQREVVKAADQCELVVLDHHLAVRSCHADA